MVKSEATVTVMEYEKMRFEDVFCQIVKQGEDFTAVTSCV